MIPMLLSFQRPDATKARPSRIHDPTTQSKVVRDGSGGRARELMKLGPRRSGY
jgi:hypothetical protein